MDISEPLKALMAHHKVTAREMAKVIGVTELTISRWKHKKHHINGRNFNALLDYFDLDSEIEFFQWGKK